ncbi:MAG: F0F1 ATP synthase subunit B [Nitrospinota bacterium]
MRILTAFLILALPVAAAASEGGGLPHATEWVTWRDGGRIFNFIIFFAPFVWLIKRFVIPALKERSKNIAASLETAEKNRIEAMKKLSDLEYKIRQFDQETGAMRSDAEKEGEKIRDQIIAEAKEVAARIIDQAKMEMQNETLKARDRLRRETAELSVKLAAQILEKDLRETDHKLIVDDYLGRLKRLQ